MKTIRNHEKGVALILAMILLLVMSVMAISLTFISRSETWSTMNYRLMSQARDAAESGVNNTANYLMGSTFSPLPTTYYTPPGSVTDPLTGYNMTAYPVQNGAGNATGHDVILSANSTSSNYPVNSVQSAFNTTGAGKGSFSAGNTTVNYATSAKLLAMQSLAPAPPFTSTSTTIQTWEITSQGTIGGVQSATGQVTAILERNISPVFGYAAFADANGCGALNFGGGGSTDSYVDGPFVGAHPAYTASDGNVGTNGNLSTIGNSTVINGNLSTPRIGVGNCSANNITADTFNGQGNQLNGSMIELPQSVVYPNPPIPAPGTNNLDSNAGCGSITGCLTVGNGNNATMHLLPTAVNQIHDLSLTGNKDLYLSAGTYNINSITEQGQTALHLETAATCALLPVAQQLSCKPVDSMNQVILQVTGLTSTGATMATPIDLTGGSVQNPSSTFDPTTFEILYAGTGTVKLKGNGTATGMLYAPNSTLNFGGGGDWYGSVICGTLSDMGGASIHYDRKLKDKFYVPGPFTVSSFTWNKY